MAHNHTQSALAAYEYFALWDDERAIIRTRGWIASTWLFMVNRYLMVFVAIIQFVPYKTLVSRIATARG